MSEAVDAGRLITKIGEDGYVRQRGDFLDISEDGMSGHCYILVSTKADKETQLEAEVRRLTDENALLTESVAKLEDAIKEITIIVDDCCEINAQHYSHDQAIEQDYALSTIRQELSRLKDKGSDV